MPRGRKKSRTERTVFLLAEGDARLAEVVGGHLDVDAVANGDAEKFFRILPEMWASTSCPLGNATRNIVPGNTCVTVPPSSIGSSLAKQVNVKYLPARRPKCKPFSGCKNMADNALKSDRLGCRI